MTPPPRHVESNAWLLVKHTAQLGLVAAVASFVLAGGRHPVLTLVGATVALVVLGTVALLDRQRFEASGIERPAGHPVVVDVVGPGAWAAATTVAAPIAGAFSWQGPAVHAPMVAGVASPTGLAPLVADMSRALQRPVDVT